MDDRLRTKFLFCTSRARGQIRGRRGHDRPRSHRGTIAAAEGSRGAAQEALLPVPRQG